MNKLNANKIGKTKMGVDTTYIASKTIQIKEKSCRYVTYYVRVFETDPPAEILGQSRYLKNHMRKIQKDLYS